MRKMFLILSVAVLALTLTASDAFAQRGGRGGGGGGRGGGRGGYYGGGFGRGYYGGGFYGGFYAPYGYGYGYDAYPYYGSGYYDSGPTYYPAPIAQNPSADASQSFYADPNVATVTVLVPNADAQIWFDDAPTSQRGMQRSFTTAPLQKAGTYSIKARWNGATQERQVRVQPGQSVTVDFRSEGVPPPQPPKQ